MQASRRINIIATWADLSNIDAREMEFRWSGDERDDEHNGVRLVEIYELMEWHNLI